MSDVRRIVVSSAPPIRDAGLGTVATRQCIAVDGAPVLPLSGEVHYSRLPRARWGAVLEAARAGGLTHVSTYVLWNHHEAIRGAYDFSGERDVRTFADTARQAGLGVILRIGPYAHAEARHGGLPDWLVASGLPLRTNDPGYLAEVDRWYARLAAELADLPLFAVQVDNELYDGAAHLTRLREMAEGHGFRAPLWTATAWGAARVPPGFLPAYGGYPESFWVDADAGPDSRSAANFYPSARRDDDTIGSDHRGGAAEATASPLPPHPFVTCELGAGMVSAYHRRLNVAAEDVAALALAKLASGSVWQGYYMFADGRNPARGLQESHETGAPNDFVELSYDFGAPLTVDAAPRASWFALRRQHLMLQTWGSALAAMPAAFPPDAVDAPDTTGLRWSVRSDGRSGFVFVVNHQPGIPLPPHPAVRFEVAAEGGIVRFPEVDIPTGAAFAWPFGLSVGPVTLAWMTAQPVTQVSWREAPLLVAAAAEGIPAEFAADADVERLADGGPGMWFALRRSGAVVARVLILDPADADAVSVVGGRLVLAPGAVVTPDRIVLRGDAALTPRAAVLTEDGWHHADVPAATADAATWTIERAAGPAPAPRFGESGRASLPTDWSAAAIARVAVDPADPRTLELTWHGDAARAWAGEQLVSDALWNGRAWRIPAEARAGAASLRIEILPAPPRAPVHFPGEVPEGAGIAAARYAPEAFAAM